MWTGLLLIEQLGTAAVTAAVTGATTAVTGATTAVTAK